MRKRSKRRGDNIIIANNTSNFNLQESYKELRTNITFLLPDKECKVIAFTSSQPKDGKTTTSINLAISLGETGNRVLIIDADMRKPRMHLLVDKVIKSGLSEVLIGKENLEDTIKQSKYIGVDVLTAGALPPNPAELLGGDRFKSILNQAHKTYDFIIVDTPPVNIVSDCLNIANVVDGVLFVVRNGETNYPGIDAAIEKLKFVNANILGFILSGVEDQSKKYYKYNYKYRKGYSYSYGYYRKGK